MLKSTQATPPTGETNHLTPAQFYLIAGYVALAGYLACMILNEPDAAKAVVVTTGAAAYLLHEIWKLARKASENGGGGGPSAVPA